MPLETKDLDPVITGITEIKAEQRTNASAVAEVKADITAVQKDVTDTKASVDSVKTDVENIKTETTELKNWRVAKDEADRKNQEYIDAQVKNGKRKTIGEPETKSFNQILAETIERNAEAIRSFRPSAGKESSHQMSFDMYTPEEKKSFGEGENIEVKTVGDMSISANFSGATTLYQDVRQPMIQSPYNRVWLADILPNGTSGGSQVVYPKENGGEGGVASWTDYTANKAQVDFDITSATSPFIWGAGYVIIQRDMLDDIPFMTTYLQNRLLISLKTWENSFIINGAGSVPGLEAVASPYNGTLTNPVDRIIDAAYGQIIDATNEFYNGNLVVTRARDLVTKIALNKASGSGEYDLPEGAVVFNKDGTVSIGNLMVIGTTSMAWDTFYALDKNATLFIRRIQPELRLFEDSVLAKKNQVMWRIEERATLVVFNNAAIVKGVLQLS